MVRNLFIASAAAIALIVITILAAGMGWFGSSEEPGSVTDSRRPQASVLERGSEQEAARLAIGSPSPKQILFGDLHVHTTFSTDAFLISLPIAQGEGSHPPADACDFARFCSALDFWSINDHAEGLTPRQWQDTVESIRQCNEVSGSGETPDTVAFLGWEWTQVGTTPEDHYGHKNVVIAGLGEDEVPARPIASRSMSSRALSGPGVVARGLMAFAGGGGRMHDFARFLAERQGNVACADGVHVKELPGDCVESVATPGELFRKLDEWELDSMVIPHGTTWGFYTPPGSSWKKQLSKAQHDPDRQRLVEVFSGHGNSEQYRDWRAVELDGQGGARCPEPTAGYLPTCWRAGEIIRGRCEAAGVASEECARRAAEARQLAAESGVAAHLTVPGESVDDWLDAGQCRDCFQPPMNHRPASSVQYMMALRNFDEPDGPERFRFGFMSSSDNHFARPGTGYKEVYRSGMTESGDVGRNRPSWLRAPEEEPEPFARPIDPLDGSLQGFQLVELERQASFFLTGGLIAVHASGRDRGSIWNAMQRKEVYGTSGPRILLWFDLVNEGISQDRLPMGSSTRMRTAPRFEVRAVGSFEQKPGCPDHAVGALSPERLEQLCKGECYYPSDVRRRITRIEVVRIRPQTRRDEPIADLIDDPWLVLPCLPDAAGCRLSFEDPDFARAGRDAVYYVRAIEAPSLAVNADNLRCVRDEAGRCGEVNRCGTAETVGDDCLAQTEERAWSSPIFVDWAE